MKNGTNSKKLSIGVQFFLAVLFLAMGAAFLMYVMKKYGYVASGNDVWGHLFKSDLMYKNILEGNLYPQYSPLWYNGIQPFRYWAPLPYYLLAGLQWIGGGNIENAYYMFAGFSFFLGGIGWLLWGVTSRRMVLCTFLGTLWFFFPENIRVFFCEGNVPRMVTTILIPYLVYFIWLYIQKEKKYALPFIIGLTALMALSHLMISAMMGIGTFLFLVFHMKETKKYVKSIQALVSMVIGYVVIGIWLLPALSGGLVGMDAEASAEVMKSLTYDLLASLDPMNRLHGIVDTFYYGIGIVFISIVGVILANKKKKAGYYTNLVILLSTTPFVVPILSKLPLSQLLWMMRFGTIAYAFFLWSLIEWKNARRYFTMLLMAILLLDCVPSFMLSRYYTQSAGRTNDELAIAEEITKQRVSILDLSAYGSYPSWELCEGEDGTQYSFGWAWQGAATASNIVMLNTALEAGNYEYLFDRSIEFGDDTVIIRKELVQKAEKTENNLLEAANKAGYELYKETNQTYILHREMPERFGVQTEYKGIGIGKFAGQIVLPYPTFTVGKSDNIEEYTFEELAQYESIFLSGFVYDKRESAEALVTKLAEQGVKVIIDMTHVPVDKNNNREYFLDVVAQDVSFTSMFPTLTYKGKNIVSFSFPEEYMTWNTKYIEETSNVLGSAQYSDQDLIFAGTNENENIIFTAFNILFHGVQTEDKGVLSIMSDICGTELYELPNRTIVPLEISYFDDKIVIDSPVDDVNTTIAYQDNFASEDGIENQNNFLYVSKGHSEIRFVYPYYNAGLVTSGVGIGGSILWILMIWIVDRKKNKNVKIDQSLGDTNEEKGDTSSKT